MQKYTIQSIDFINFIYQFLSFLVAVMADVANYYICKWLDGNDSDN